MKARFPPYGRATYLAGVGAKTRLMLEEGGAGAAISLLLLASAVAFPGAFA